MDCNLLNPSLLASLWIILFCITINRMSKITIYAKSSHYDCLKVDLPGVTIFVAFEMHSAETCLLPISWREITCFLVWSLRLSTIWFQLLSSISSLTTHWDCTHSYSYNSVMINPFGYCDSTAYVCLSFKTCWGFWCHCKILLTKRPCSKKQYVSDNMYCTELLIR